MTEPTAPSRHYILDILWHGGNTTTEGIDTEAGAVELRRFLLMMGRAKSVAIWKVTAAERVETNDNGPMTKDKP